MLCNEFIKKNTIMYMYVYIQYLTEVSTHLFIFIFYYIFSGDNTEEMRHCYNVK